MDLLKLALDPRKANRRFSPFTNALPPGMERRLKYAFGDRASADPNDLAVYSRDAASPPAALDLALKRRAWAVVRPATTGDLLEVIRFARDNFIPIVPRGSGTSGTGGALPTEGGVVVDMRSFDRIVAVDKAAKTATVEAGVRFWDLETRLRAEGLALRQYPTSARGATIGGWLATGGGGVGSHRYGPFANDVVRVRAILPDGAERTFEGPDLALVNDAHGITGFLVEITLRVRPASTDTPILATFADDDGERAAGAVRAIGESHAAWNVSWYTPEFTELLNEAGGAKLLPAGKHSVLVTLEGDGRKPDVVRILQAEGGEVGKDEAAQKAWDARFDHLNFKRLGPSVLVAESVIDGIGLWKAVEASLAVTRVERQCVWVIGVAPDRYDVIWYALDDERRMEFAPALGNSLAVMHAVKKLGGRSYGTGVLLASEAGHVYGKERLRRWKEFKKEHDRDELFNPGPVLGARMRGAPVRIFSTVMKAQGPLLRGARGTAGKWPGGPLADPGFLAKHAALGRERAGDLAEVDYAATTCIFCGFCDSVAPERARVHWETEMPRGRVQLAVAHLRGRAEYTREGQRKVLRNPLSYQREAICPTRIPIDRVTDLLAGAFGAALGPLQEHEALVANVKQHGNVQGKPREARAKWAAFPVTPDATTLLVVDDAGSYDAPDVAAAAAAALTNAQVALAYLGAKEPSVGTVLVETGNRDAARETATSLLQEAAKRRLRTVVTPDANAWRVLRLDYPLFARDLGTTWDVDVRHSTEVLAEAVKSKRLTLETPWPKKAVVHVPEALAGKARDAVVDLAKAIPGATILPWGGDCCGHGRALHLTDPEMQTAAAERMLKEAIAVGAEAVLTANPGCAALLKSVAKKAKAGVEVIDLHEVVARSMTMAAAGAAVAAPAAAEPQAPKEPEIPQDHYRVEFVKEGVILAVHKNANVLAAGEEAGLELPSSCKAGSCDTCSARWEGTAADQSAGAALTAEQQKTFVLTCIARPKGPVKIWSNERPK